MPPRHFDSDYELTVAKPAMTMVNFNAHCSFGAINEVEMSNAQLVPRTALRRLGPPRTHCSSEREVNNTPEKKNVALQDKHRDGLEVRTMWQRLPFVYRIVQAQVAML